MKRALSFEKAKATFTQRYTMEHVPGWAREQLKDGTYYAPGYRTDREWYEATNFPGEGGIHGNAHHCESRNQTWPLGSSLSAPLKCAR